MVSDEQVKDLAAWAMVSLIGAAFAASVAISTYQTLKQLFTSVKKSFIY